MENWAGKVAIVTGASSGIGAETVEALVRYGIRVVGLARRVEKIRQLAEKLKGCKGKIYPIECDVQKEGDILKTFDWVEKQLGGVDILINNAGVFSTENIIEGSTETYRRILEVNVLAYAICSREAIKSMRKRKIRGHIIVSNSILGHNAEIVHQPVSLYAASKYAVTGMSTSLRIELNNAGANIKVTSISPGLVATDMPLNAGMPTDVLKKISITAKDVADAIVYALGTPPNVQVDELTITPMARLSDLTKPAK